MPHLAFCNGQRFCPAGNFVVSLKEKSDITMLVVVKQDKRTRACQASLMRGMLAGKKCCRLGSGPSLNRRPKLAGWMPTPLKGR